MSQPVYWDSMCRAFPFWDHQTVWNTTTPDFTQCFQKTILIWAPCSVLWLLAPFEIYGFYKSRYKNVPWTILNIVKLVICLALFLVDLFSLLDHTGFHNLDVELQLLDMLGAVVRGLTILLAAALIWIGKLHGIISSGLLLCFWFVNTIANAIIFRSFHLRVYDEFSFVDTTEFILAMIYFPLIVVQLILVILPDEPPLQLKVPHEVGVLNFTGEEGSSFLSKIFFVWYDRLALLGYRRALEEKDLDSLKHPMRCKTIVTYFDRTLKNVIDSIKKRFTKPIKFDNQTSLVSNNAAWDVSSKPFLTRALLKAFGPEYGFVIFLRLMTDFFSFMTPLILNQVIMFASSGSPSWHGFVYASLLFICSFVEAMFNAHCNQSCGVLSLKIRSALMSFVFRKALKLSSKAKATTTVGEIVNYMAVDIHKIVGFVDFSPMAITSPFLIIIALVELWMFLGPSSLVTLLVIAVIQGLTFIIIYYIKKNQRIFMKLKDKRIKLMNEILNGMKLLKLFAWENPFADYINEFRKSELIVLRRNGILIAANTIFWGSSTVFITLGVFGVYVLISPMNILDASTAFVSITIFNLLKRPLNMLPNVISAYVEANVSITRINKFSNCEEIDRNDIQVIKNGDVAILVQDAEFSWGEDTPILSDINLSIKNGSLTAIVGPVGAGKSSLISAFLGEMNKLKGSIACVENVAFAPQLPWIQNSSLKNNILFGKPFVESKYKTVLKACALLPDLGILPAGDATEIGERGINLSGGQKQRISIARAIYSEASVYFFDDPLSAVDAHVGKHIFENVLGPKGLLRDQTRILVTHSLTYVSQTNEVVVLSNGSISEIGSYDELLKKQGTFAELIATYVDNGKESEEVSGEFLETRGTTPIDRQLSVQSAKSNKSAKLEKSISYLGPGNEKPGSKGGLIKAETVETGKVRRKIYITYLSAFGFPAIMMILCFVATHICNAGSTIWLSEWSDDQPNPDGTQNTSLRDLRLGVYAALGLAFSLFLFTGVVFLFIGACRASSTFHSKMLTTILHTPQWFFDTTPVGRILNRFSSDIDTVDLSLPHNLRMWLSFILQTAVGFIVILMAIPWFTLVAFPSVIFFYLLQMFNIESGRQLRRLDSATKSPIYSLFSESISGVSTIRAFKHEDLFFRNLMGTIDKNVTCSYLSLVAQRWLVVRMELLGGILLFAAALFAVFQSDQSNSFTPGTVGLIVSYTLMITSNLKTLFHANSMIETNIVSIERITNYTTSVPQEPDWTKPNSSLPDDWPTRGAIRFEKYATKYREELDNVLKGISCNIQAGEKVGVIGRTGAGKSSLTLALFRIIESTSGSILIDGVDISKLGLHELRSRLTIIPQDPVLFSGTLRRNLDPFDKHYDGDLWAALEHAHLKDFVSSLPAGLLHEVSEGGENLSVGQRQLICLARALLRKSQILVLDEATAAVDLEMDDLIQATIRREFAHCTVLTVAHRLNTIMDADRIMVLDKGEIKEFDSPVELLKNKNTMYYSMAKDAGLI